MTRTALIAFLTVLCLPATPRADETAARASVERYHGTVTRRAEVGRALIRVDGVITPAVAEAFSDALEALPAGRPVAVELDSPGGFTRAGYAMIEAILARRAAGGEVVTRVLGQDACESMCVGVFMAGERREAGPDARFMVHSPRSDSTGLVSTRATRDMVDRLVSLGASDGWIRRVSDAGAFSGRAEHRESAAELYRGGANVVTELLPPR
jgi:ATP-dependent protease ClpP protease subunit